MFNLFKKQPPKIICQDENYFSPGEKIIELEERIKLLEDQVKDLKQENIGIINEMYEIENNLDLKIDKIHPVIYNIKND